AIWRDRRRQRWRSLHALWLGEHSARLAAALFAFPRGGHRHSRPRRSRQDHYGAGQELVAKRVRTDGGVRVRYCLSRLAPGAVERAPTAFRPKGTGNILLQRPLECQPIPRSATTLCRIIREDSFFDQEASDDEGVHPGTKERANRVRWSVYDGFSAQIKRSIQDHGHASALLECIDQAPIEGIDIFLHGLRTRTAVYMRNSRNHAALLGSYLRCQNHKRRIHGGLQVLARGFFLERGSKRPPPFAEFHGI